MKPLKQHLGAKKRFPFLGAFFALFVGCFALVVLLGTAPGSALESVPLEADPDGEWTPLALSAGEGRIWLVCGGPEQGLLLRLDGVGRVEDRVELPGPLRWAALRGGTLFLREDRADGAALIALDPETFQEIGRRELNLLPRELIVFDCDEAGNAAYVLSGSPDRLRLSDSTGAETIHPLPGDCTLLAADGDTWLAASGLELTVIGPAGERTLSCLSEVVGSLGGGLVLDRDGVVCRVGETGLTALLRGSSPLFSPLSFCLDGENSPILSSSAGTVTRYSPEGSLLGTCSLAGTPLAVCGAGAVFRRDGWLQWSRFPFEASAPEATPGPEAEAAEAEIRVEGVYLLAPAGTTAARIRELLEPDTADIRDPLGHPVTQGRLGTGMTVNDWTVVIRGDCTGTGAVTRGDLRAAMRMILSGKGGGSPAFRAADLNDDGALDGKDIILLSQKIQ